MIEQQLTQQIDRVAHRIRRFRLLGRLAVCWFVAAVVGIGLLLADWLSGWSLHTAAYSWLAALSAAVVLFAGLGCLALVRRRDRDRLTAAREIERTHPDLEDRLLAAAEQQPDPHSGLLSYLQKQVIHEALTHSRRHDWRQTVPTRRYVLSHCLQLACFGLWATVCFALFGIEPIGDLQVTSEFGAPIPASAGIRYQLSVEPGDTEVERGTPLLVLARFAGQLPADVTLVFTDKDQVEVKSAMTKSLDDPLFGGRIPTVDNELTYRIEYDDQTSKPFRVSVFEFPELKRADVTVTFPNYTGLPETVIEDTRRVSVVEGSTVTLACTINKPIATARLLHDDDTAILLEAANDSDVSFHVTLRPKSKQRYRLELVDEQGRRNKFPPEFVIDVVPNRRPDLKLALPGKDLRVSPVEEVSLKATAWDDFGVQQYGFIYSMPGSEPNTVVLGNSIPAKENQDLVHLLSFEKLAAEPDQLVSYYFFADDFGPDGKLRRTFSDMYFAEVRPFEEIFRQGQQPPGGQSKMKGGGPKAKKMDELAKLQKQIINATWKLIRRETSGQPSEKFTEDVNLIKQSQEAALDKTRELAAKVKDAKSKAFVAAVIAHMQRAVKQLSSAVDKQQTDPLMPGLNAEQAAYQALLKLRAREHQVTKGQKGGGGGGGGGNRSQQQLNQLELSNKKNRYESGRNAPQRRSAPADREQLQVLNRLRELARRQSGVNDKLKELENELRAAKTEQDQEELRRQLKRLRDEQQQMLRDIDKLSQRMDRPENQKTMADSRKQLEQTRSKVLQASEALKKGQVSKALGAGTRAQRELQQLQNEFRKKTAGQFSDAMKHMRQQARELAERQNQLANQLDQTQKNKQRSLRYSKDRDDIERGLEDQKRKLDDVLNQMRDVIEKAEQSEPLLSKQLYDTVRKSRELKPAQNLESASRLVNRGLMDQAAETEKQARLGIDAVKRGIEKAAEGVLGNELDALKRAQDELKELSRSVQQEVAQADPAGQRNGPRQKDAGSNPQGTRPQQQSGKGRLQPERYAELPRDKQSGQRSNNSKPSKTGRQSPGQTPSSAPNSQQKNAQNPGSASGQPQSGSQKSGNPSGKSSPQGSSGKPNGGKGLRGGQPQGNRSLSSSITEGGFSGGPGGPLTGSNFQEWPDRMRDVEEMVDDPKLRAEVAKIRQRARSMRAEFKRHSKEPEWALVRTSILQPLAELQIRLAEEIAKRESNDALVPIDRDPVPKRFTEMVRRYYERLGSGK